MATEVELPALGESVTEGTVSRWLKSVGDTVEVDEPLLEVSTDKVDTEIPSPVAGVLLSINADEDETVEVGDILCTVGDESEADGAGGGSSDDGDESDAADEDDAAEEEPETETAEAPDAEEAPEQDGPEEPADGGADEQQGSGGGGGGGTEVELPALGESVTEGTVSRWLKSVGDTVEMDEPLLEVSTDKVDTEIPSPVAGTLQEIRVQEDETVEVGDVLCVVGDGSGSGGGGGSADSGSEPEPEQVEDPVEEEPAAEQAPEPTKEEEKPAKDAGSAKDAGDAAPSKPAARATEGDGGDSEAYVTPLVRKLAKQHGVDLGSVEGTGVGGRIRKQDVLDAAKAANDAKDADSAPAASGGGSSAPAGGGSGKPAPAAPKPAEVRGKTEKMSRLRKVIAERMHASLQVSAQLTTVVEVDVTRIARLRDAEKADFHRREGVKLSFMPFFAKAAIDALKEHASLNASIDMEAGEITYYDHENVAIAVDTEKGLLTPVIKDAGDLSIAGLAKKIADLAERTRTNKVGPDELSGGTFTLTNTGSRGALFDTPIINQPQVAILGTGSVVKRAVVMDDPNLGETIAVRQMVYLALTYDHRLVDGADAARFLSDVKDRLENGNWDV